MGKTTVVITGMLAACVAFPAAAAKKSADSQALAASPSWAQCYEQALNHGLQRSHKGHEEYMKDCQAGKIPTVSRASVPVGGTFEQCEARALALGMPHGQTGHVEYVRECMGQRPSSRKLGG